MTEILNVKIAQRCEEVAHLLQESELACEEALAINLHECMQGGPPCQILNSLSPSRRIP